MRSFRIVKTLSISCPPEGLHDELRREANIQGITIGRLAVKALKIGLKQMRQERVAGMGRLMQKVKAKRMGE